MEAPVSDVKTPAGRAALLAVCEAAPKASGSRFIALARTALPEAIEYIERLEREREVLNKALDVAERELADTRKANEILEASAVADLQKLAEVAQLVRFGPSPEVVDAAEDAARKRRGRGRR